MKGCMTQLTIIVTLTKVMIISKLRCLYHLRKPRVPTETSLAYSAYKQQLRLARKKVHKESVQYLNQIQDAYLNEHKEAMKKQHFQNQCSFRKQIFTDSYRLFENQSKWAKEDQRFTSALNKHLHDEDVRKINRSRILKIMKHQSTNYWFNAENVDQRLKESTIFPEWVASSEYYYRLFAEAMSYELGDFHELHMVTSNQEIIRQKNKYMIPLYLTLRNKIRDYLKNPESDLQKKMAYDLNLIKSNRKANAEELYAKTKKEYQQKIAQFKEEKKLESRQALLKRKIKELVSIFKTWKEYTNVLSLTSAQVINNQGENRAEKWIKNKEIQVVNNLKKQKGEEFVDSIEEDTEEVEISFEEYLSKIKQQAKNTTVHESESAAMEELDSLLSQIDPVEQVPTEKVPLDLTGLVQREGIEGLKLQTSDELNPMFLNPNQTTASVEILKNEFKNDAELVSLLNNLGEIDVRYPKLFEEIWRSCSQ